jgi:HK97 family phage portal protein
VITHPGKLSDPARKHLKESLNDKHAGVGNAHSPMVLEENMTWKQAGITNRDAQFLESRSFSVLDVCRIFGVPPHMVGDLDRATYSNIEQQSLEFIMYTLAEWIVLWEQAISRDLILAPDTYYANFDLDSLLRGDKLSRYQSYHWSLTDGWMNRNEVRASEGLNRVDGLDDFLRQANMAPGSSLSATPKNPSQPSDKEPDEDDAEPEDEPGARGHRLAAAVHETRRRINEQREAA